MLAGNHSSNADFRRDDRDVGDDGLDAVVDAGDQRRGVAAERHAGQRDPVDAGELQIVEHRTEVVHRLRHRLGEPGEPVGEVAVTAVGRTLFGATAVERQRVQQHVVARPVEPRQREEQSVEQVRRTHEAVDQAQRGMRPVVVRQCWACTTLLRA